MVDKFFSVFTTALVITGVGIALRPGAQTSSVIKSWMNGFAAVEKSASH